MPTPKKPAYDFTELAKASIPEMYAGRIQAFLEKMQIVYPDCSQPLHVLDLGGGTGILSIEFVKLFPNSKATVFETLAVTAVTQKIICEHHAESKVDIISGDFPGIHSAELARRFGITRAVVHKTLQKLSDRGLIMKEDDCSDKKRFLLYLTEKGRAAYQFHEKYHKENDKALFDFLANMPGDKLAAIKGFLDCAIELVQNHA